MKPLRNILEELRRRRFPAILAIYCAGGFALLETIDDLSGRFGWPSEVFNVALTLLLVGILNVFIAAWFHGAAKTQRWERRELSLHLVPVLLAAAIIGTAPGPDGENDRVLDPNRLMLTGFNAEPDGQAGQQFGDSLASDISKILSGTTEFRVERTSNGNPASQLAGRIMTNRGRIRISVELSDAGSGIQLWSETFERDSALSAGERRQVASRIALSVAETLQKNFMEE